MPCHYPHLFLACVMKANRQVIDFVSVMLARRIRFLADVEHDDEFIAARPVGAERICVGRTGRPTPHPTSGAYRHRVGSKSGRHLAAGISEDERPQSRLSVFQSGQGGPGANPNSPLGTDARRLPPTRRVFADRGHQRTGLQLPSGLARIWDRLATVAVAGCCYTVRWPSGWRRGIWRTGPKGSSLG